MDCVPHLLLPRGRVHVMSLRPPRPGQPQYPHHSCPYRISKSDEAMIINDWKKCFNHRRELLGSNIVRRPRLGDKMISVLHYGEFSSLNEESMPILFYDILPKRGQSRSYERSRSQLECVIMCYNVLELMRRRRSSDCDQ